MNTYTDTQLKQALTKMLPELLEIQEQGHGLDPKYVLWYRQGYAVLDTELLHLCWLVEETLNDVQFSCYATEFGLIEFNCYPNELFELKQGIHAAWQQRVIALAKVKGIKII